MALEESTSPDDTVTEVEGIKFLIDSDQLFHFENVKLDFKKNIFGLGGFELVNI